MNVSFILALTFQLQLLCFDFLSSLSLPGYDSKVDKKQTSEVLNAIINGINSPPHPFFVTLHILDSVKGLFCGGTLIANQWVLASANCVNKTTVDNVFVEVGDYSAESEQRCLEQVNVKRIFVHPRYHYEEKPRNNLALLKLEKNTERSLLSLCTKKPEDGTLLATVGLGSISTKAARPASILQQTFFFETALEYLFNDRMKICEKETICTEPLTGGSNTCLFDDGGPLYIVNCSQTQKTPLCLYGVASFFIQDPKRPKELCTGGSVFTRVPDFITWISDTIVQFAHD